MHIPSGLVGSPKLHAPLKLFYNCITISVILQEKKSAINMKCISNRKYVTMEKHTFIYNFKSSLVDLLMLLTVNISVLLSSPDSVIFTRESS